MNFKKIFKVLAVIAQKRAVKALFLLWSLKKRN